MGNEGSNEVGNQSTSEVSRDEQCRQEMYDQYRDCKNEGEKSGQQCAIEAIEYGDRCKSGVSSGDSFAGSTYPQSGESDRSYDNGSSSSQGSSSSRTAPNPSSNQSVPPPLQPKPLVHFCDGISCADPKDLKADEKLRESKPCRNQMFWLEKDWSQCGHQTAESVLACKGFCHSVRIHFARKDLETRNIISYRPAWAGPVSFSDKPSLFTTDWKKGNYSHFLARSLYMVTVPKGNHQMDYYVCGFFGKVYDISLYGIADQADNSPNWEKIWQRLRYRLEGNKNDQYEERLLLTRNYMGETLDYDQRCLVNSILSKRK